MGQLLDAFKKMRANLPIKNRLSDDIELDNQPDLSQYNDDIIEGDRGFHPKHPHLSILNKPKA